MDRDGGDLQEGSSQEAVKVTPKELEIQLELVKRLYFEIEELKEAQIMPSRLISKP
jgi:hypothetical protein